MGGPSVPTPPRVVKVLTAAFGASKVGETGYEIDAAKCTSEAEKAEALRRGSSLLYGEFLPDGVSKVLGLERLGGALQGASSVLELGMGSGKVALQIFVQCPTVRNMLGIELVQSRYLIGEAALQRLAATLPDVYSVRSHTPGELIRVECDGGRRIEFRCADFFTLGLNLCERSDAIVFAVNVPCKGFPELCRRLAQAKEGCRLLTYHALDTIWWSSEPCPFHQVEANVPESDTFSTSWSPQGYRFYVYVADRRRCPAIDSSVRNETYTQWQAVWDEASNAHYYHNQETEISQWEVPTHAGGWEAVWSEEHDAYFFWHGPSGHSQWAAPRCLADLSWGAS